MRRFSWPGGLSARLLLLTALFVMAGTLLILGPSVAAYEEGWLTDRVRLAEVASLAVEAAPAGAVSEKVTNQLLTGAGVISVSIQSEGVRRLLLAAPRLSRTPLLVDLRDRNAFDRMAAVVRTLGWGAPETLRVVARPQFRSGDFVEIVVPEAPLRRDVGAYLGRQMLTAVFVSVVAGVLVYLALNSFLVRPMQRITTAMERFRARPEDPAARLTLSHRRDEIGRAEEELHRMQEDLVTALQSRARLAALGEAVAKINHDLRNMLTSARLASDRLASSPDPKVAQALPRLERALDRAAKLTENVLAYGRSEEPAPVRMPVPARAAARAAAEDAGLSHEAVTLELDDPADVTVNADADQLHRILVNLFRNARQAVEQAGRERGIVRVTASHADGLGVLLIADDGPGLPARVRDRLFQPFSSSATPDGSGLGLAIARELARAHGGDLELDRSDARGTVFRLTLPD
ncbi:HAMP domain-containing sensor histidine kinase [soil metagenome]